MPTSAWSNWSARPCSLIFELEGETGFRMREAQLLGELLRGRNQVIATGGGAVLSPSHPRVVEPAQFRGLHPGRNPAAARPPGARPHPAAAGRRRPARETRNPGGNAQSPVPVGGRPGVRIGRPERRLGREQGLRRRSRRNGDARKRHERIESSVELGERATPIAGRRRPARQRPPAANTCRAGMR